jgi:hypothetical protein
LVESEGKKRKTQERSERSDRRISFVFPQLRTILFKAKQILAIKRALLHPSRFWQYTT